MPGSNVDSQDGNISPKDLTAEDHDRAFLKIASSLRDAELGALYRSRSKADPAGKSRDDMLQWLKEQNLVDEDFLSEVGQIKSVVSASQEELAAGSQDKNYSCSPGKWVPIMSQGPSLSQPLDPSTRKQRLKWALELHRERGAVRARLEAKQGVAYKTFNNDSKKYEECDEAEGELCYTTGSGAGRATLEQLAQRFDLSVAFLLHLNSDLYAGITETSPLSKGTVIILEDDIPSDMIDDLNEHLGLGADDDDVDEPGPDLGHGEAGAGGLAEALAAKKKAREAPELSVDAAAARAQKRVRLAPPASQSVLAENEKLKQLLGQQLAGKKVDETVLRRFGVPDPRSAKQPPKPFTIDAGASTQEAMRVQKGLLGTADRVSKGSTGGETPAPYMNPMEAFRAGNMTPRDPHADSGGG